MGGTHRSRNDEFRAPSTVIPMMSASAPQTIAFAIWGPIARDDLPGLTDRVCALLRGSGAASALCDVTGVEPDAVTVDALARLQLAAGRLGCRCGSATPRPRSPSSSP